MVLGEAPRTCGRTEKAAQILSDKGGKKGVGLLVLDTTRYVKGGNPYGGTTIREGDKDIEAWRRGDDIPLRFHETQEKTKRRTVAANRKMNL